MMARFRALCLLHSMPERVKRAADFEGSGRLFALELEVNVTAEPSRQSFGAQETSGIQPQRQNLFRFLNAHERYVMTFTV